MQQQQMQLQRSILARVQRQRPREKVGSQVRPSDQGGEEGVEESVNKLKLLLYFWSESSEESSERAHLKIN